MLRERFDRDRSGALEPGEKTALAEYLAVQATRFAQVFVDGRPLTLKRASLEPALGAGEGGTLAVTVTLVQRAALGGGAHRVRLVDRYKDAGVAVPVTVSANGVVAPAPAGARVLDGQPLELEVRPAPGSPQ